MLLIGLKFIWDLSLADRRCFFKEIDFFEKKNTSIKSLNSGHYRFFFSLKAVINRCFQTYNNETTLSGPPL